MPDTALALLAKFADRFGLTMEQVRFLRHALRLARRERSAALLRVVMGLVREREQLRRQVDYLTDRNETLGRLVGGRAGRG
jgi:hypothetical protein